MKTITKGELQANFDKAMELLKRVVEKETPAPDAQWFTDYFTLTGDHMILTEEGWEPGDVKKVYMDDWEKNPDWSNPILSEVNAQKEEVANAD